MNYITAKSFPLDEDGAFQSRPAEAAFQEARNYGLTRSAVRLILQAFECERDRCTREYKAWAQQRDAQGGEAGP